MKKAFIINESIEFGWNKFKANFAPLLITVLIMMYGPQFLYLPAYLIFWIGFLGIALQFYPLSCIGFYTSFQLLLLMIFCSIFMRLIFYKVTLMAHDNMKFKPINIFEMIEVFLKYFAGSLLYGLIVFCGLILCIVPGIIWGIKLQFFAYLIIDKKMGPIEALTKSWNITKGSKWNLFLLGIMSLLINFAGLIAFCVGMFIAMPVTMLMYAYAYRKLLAHAEANKLPPKADSPASNTV